MTSEMLTMKGARKLKDQIEKQAEVDALVAQINCRIEELKPCARQAGPGLARKCKEEIGSLIIDREAIRRGLLRVSEAGDLCLSCPAKEL
jgi:hypothetical protein